MKKKLTIKQRIKACFILLVSGSLPSWWWSDLSNKFYESKIAHDYPEHEGENVMTYSKHVWEDIGKKIGWCPFTAALSYFEYLNKKQGGS